MKTHPKTTVVTSAMLVMRLRHDGFRGQSVDRLPEPRTNTSTAQGCFKRLWPAATRGQSLKIPWTSVSTREVVDGHR